MTSEDYQDDTAAVMKIAQKTEKLLEARRKKEDAKKMARLMRNFNYELLRGGEETMVETQVETCKEVDVEDPETQKIRKLQDMQEEIESGMLLTVELCSPKYEAPLITQLRSVETVDELYHLADQIIPLSSLNR